MRAVLSERGFTEIDTLMGRAATRAGILTAIDRLVESAEAGDHLVFYFSGHGAQVIDAAGRDRGAFETVVPHDAGLGASDIVDKTLRMKWNAALDAVGPDGSLTVIQDNCHSGSGSRNASELRDPFKVARQAGNAEGAEVPPEADWGPEPDARGALLLSAAQDREMALELTVGDDVYGGFTHSLARALRATPPGAPAHLVFERARSYVRALGLMQEPVIEGPRDRPLFGEPPAPGGGTAVGVVQTAGDRVILAGGQFMGLNPGAEARRILTTTPGSEPLADTTVTVRVVAVTDAVRSVAEVVRGDAASLREGDLFQITRPVPMASDPLRLWLPPALADDATVRAAADAPCPDPACSGTDYRPLPPTAEFRDALAAQIAEVPGVALTEGPAGADYWLAGHHRPDGSVRYRWVRRASMLTGDTLRALPEYRSDVPGDPTGARSLAVGTGRIARVHGWLTIQSPSAAAFPVEILGLVRESDGLVLRPTEAGVLTIPPSAGLCRQQVDGETLAVVPADPERCYRLALGVTPDALAAYRALRRYERLTTRYAYPFMIDPEGAAFFLPVSGRADASAASAAVEATLDLSDPDQLTEARTGRGEPVWIFDPALTPRFAMRSGPFGRHTVVLLTTNDPVPRPGEAFSWPAIGAGTRGTDGDGPDSWSVHRLTLDVVPGALDMDSGGDSR